MKANREIIPAEEILSFQEVSVSVPPPYEFGLEDINLVLRAGEMTIINKDRGHGLCPLFDVAQGLILPDQGNVYFMGKNWKNISSKEAAALRHGIGRVFSRGGWISNLNVDENITLGQRYHTDQSREEIYQKAEKLGKLFGLKSLPDTRPAHTKESLLLRAGLVRAFLGDPRLILLEEPLQKAYNEILHNLMQVIGEVLINGAAVLWLTADMTFLENTQLDLFKTFRMKGPRMEEIQ